MRRLGAKGEWPRLRLYWSALCLGAFVGGTATIASATRVIIQWAKSHDFQLRPLLLSLGAPLFAPCSPPFATFFDGSQAFSTLFTHPLQWKTAHVS